MGQHNSKTRQPLSPTAKGLLLAGATLIGLYGWYTESAKNPPQQVADSSLTPNANTNRDAAAVGTPAANPWGSPSPPLLHLTRLLSIHNPRG